jgi:hypothetical protein
VAAVRSSVLTATLICPPTGPTIVGFTSPAAVKVAATVAQHRRNQLPPLALVPAALGDDAGLTDAGLIDAGLIKAGLIGVARGITAHQGAEHLNSSKSVAASSPSTTPRP